MRCASTAPGSPAAPAPTRIAASEIDDCLAATVTRSRGAESVDVLLLRHAATGWNDSRRRQGWADEPLTDAARRATAAWADRAPASLSTVACSDLRRAVETAEIIAASLALEDVEAMRGLREQHQGAWTGLTKEQIKLRWPERLRERPRRPVDGESAETVLRRVLAALGHIATVHQGRCVLIVTHNGVIHTLERAAGVDAPPVPHLEGRWFRVLSPTDSSSAVSVSSLLVGELTAGRRGPAGGAAAGRSIRGADEAVA
jgi:broad specificity phosphatase PhoE